MFEFSSMDGGMVPTSLKRSTQPTLIEFSAKKYKGMPFLGFEAHVGICENYSRDQKNDHFEWGMVQFFEENSRLSD